MRGADIDQQTMPLVGRMQIEQQRLGTRQMKAARQLQPRRQQRVALAQLAQLSIGMQGGKLAQSPDSPCGAIFASAASASLLPCACACSSQ